MVQKLWFQGLGLSVLLGVFLHPTMSVAQQPALPLMPMPASVQAGSGSMKLDSTFSVALMGHTEPRLDRAVDRFLRQLVHQTALPLAMKVTKGPKASLVIQTDHASKEVQEIGEDDSYVLEVSASGARLTAP